MPREAREVIGANSRLVVNFSRKARITVILGIQGKRIKSSGGKEQIQTVYQAL